MCHIYLAELVLFGTYMYMDVVSTTVNRSCYYVFYRAVSGATVFYRAVADATVFCGVVSCVCVCIAYVQLIFVDKI